MPMKKYAVKSDPQSEILKVDLPAVPIMTHNEIHEALYTVVAALAIHIDTSFTKLGVRDGKMADTLLDLSRMAGAFDPLWRQSAAALSAGPGEFGHFMVSSAENRLRFREALEKAVGLAGLDRIVLNVPKLATSSVTLLQRMFQKSNCVFVTEVTR